MIEKLEVGRKYVDSSGDEVIVLFSDGIGTYYKRGSERFSVSTYCALSFWSELPKPKKCYWLWDVKTNEKSHIVKSAAYMDDEGRASNGCTIYNKDMLIKKHESEFIEVDA